MILGIEIGLTLAVCAMAALYCHNTKRGTN
jgi:hypothetical protein